MSSHPENVQPAGYLDRMTRRQFMLAGAALAATGALGHSISRADTEATAPKADAFALVDPELRAVLQPWLKQNPTSDWSEDNLPAMRRMVESFTQPQLPYPPVIERTIRGRRGAPDVRVFVIGALSEGSAKAAVLHLHGGGYVAGTARQDIRSLQQLATTHDCVVVTVDYRLAPQVRFPGALEDSYAALVWLYSNSRNLGVDPSRIVLLGESAGGGLAATLAIAARDRAEVPIAMQILIYPMLDDRTGSIHAVPTHIGAFVWTAASNRFGWTSLLGVPAGAPSVPRGAVPARVENLAGLPPTFIGTGAIDLFVREDVTYAQRLLEAGVPTELHVVPGAFHAFDVLAPQATVSKRFTAAWNDALARHIEAK